MEALKVKLADSTLIFLRRIVSTRRVWLTIVWTVLLLLFAAVFIFLSFLNVTLYLAQPTNVHIKMSSKDLEFPSVSFCSLNPYKYSALQMYAPETLLALKNYSDNILERTPQKPSGDPGTAFWNQKNQTEQQEIKVRARRAVSINRIDNSGTMLYTTFTKAVSTSKQRVFLSTDSPTLQPVTITTSNGALSYNPYTEIVNTNINEVNYDTLPSAVSIRLTSDVPFVVHNIDGGHSGTLVLPQETLGTDYLIVAPVPDSATLTDTLFIIGTTTGTTDVTIVRPNAVVQTFNVVERGVQIVKASNTDRLAGARVTATKPIAVIVHAITRYVNIYSGCSGTDKILEQLPPVPTLGLQFVLAPFKSNCNSSVLLPCCTREPGQDYMLCNCYELYQVVALEDNTQVTRQGYSKNDSFVLKAGESKDFVTIKTDFSYLTATKPVIIARYGTGGVEPGGLNGPSMVIVPSTDGYKRDYSIDSCFPESATSHYVNIIIRSSQAAGLLLNKSPFLTSTVAHPIPGTHLEAYQYQLPCTGSIARFTFTHKDPSCRFALLAYGMGVGTGYAFLGGLTLQSSSYLCTPTNQNTVPPTPADELDNDCDGWIDEETRNFLDDDFDGLTDEDLSAKIPVITADEQTFICSSSDPIVAMRENCMSNTTATYEIDDQCLSPIQLSFGDVTTQETRYISQVDRTWHLIDSCGNIADDVVQKIVIMTPIAAMAWATPQHDWLPTSSEADSLQWSTAMMDASLYFIAALDSVTKAHLAYELKEILFWCQFDNRDCDLTREISKHADETLGNCFTFTPMESSRNVKRAGVQHGLQMIFKARSDDYQPFIMSSGLKLLVHDEYAPVVMDSGIGITAGMEYSYAIRQAIISSINRCKQSTSPYLYASKFYTDEACLKTCHQEQVKNSCICADPQLPTFENVSYCNITQKFCVDKTSNGTDYEALLTNCECLFPCQSTIYNTISTKSKWPAPGYPIPLCKKLRGRQLKACNADFGKNYSRLNLYYDQLTVINLEEFNAYGLIDLLYDLSNNAGMWLGLCCIGFVEVLFFPIWAIYLKIKAK